MALMTVKIERVHVLILALFIGVLFLAFNLPQVTSYGTSNPTNFGHTYGELTLNGSILGSDISDNTITNVDISPTADINGAKINSRDLNCLAITGGAGLCDGTDTDTDTRCSSWAGACGSTTFYAGSTATEVKVLAINAGFSKELTMGVTESPARYGYVSYHDYQNGGYPLVLQFNSSDPVIIHKTTKSGGYSLEVNGNICEADTSLSACSSDVRLKENIKPLENGLDLINSLKVKSFNFIGNGKTQAGLIAQDLMSTHPDWVEKHTTDDYYTYNDNDFIKFATVKAIQELKAENDSLKAENKEMKDVLCELKPTTSFCN